MQVDSHLGGNFVLLSLPGPGGTVPSQLCADVEESSTSDLLDSPHALEGSE